MLQDHLRAVAWLKRFFIEFGTLVLPGTGPTRRHAGTAPIHRAVPVRKCPRKTSFSFLVL
jgi:hypothetical protein